MRDLGFLNLRKKDKDHKNKMSRKISKNNCKKLVSSSNKIINNIKCFVEDFIFDDSILLLIWLAMGVTIAIGIYIIIKSV